VSVVVVIQARTGSTRLPGKVLADLGDRPMLAFQLERLAPLPDAELVVATTDLERDDAVADLAAARGVACVRGPEDDVVARFALAVTAHPAAVVVRLTADCPLIDPALVEAVVALRAATGADYAGNTAIRTFPDGLDVEAMTAETFAAVVQDATDPLDREHVTRFVLRRPNRFRIANLRAPVTLADERWTIDTPADLDRVRHIVAALDHPQTAGWEEILAVAGTTTRPAVDAVQPDVVADLTIDQLPQEA
jgi:spore coat polysaccharide biosynthesis protein SpsF (cytidylyltransferase family)